MREQQEVARCAGVTNEQKTAEALYWLDEISDEGERCYIINSHIMEGLRPSATGEDSPDIGGFRLAEVLERLLGAGFLLGELRACLESHDAPATVEQRKGEALRLLEEVKDVNDRCCALAGHIVERLRPPATGEDSPDMEAFRLAEVLESMLQDVRLFSRLRAYLDGLKAPTPEARQPAPAF